MTSSNTAATTTAQTRQLKSANVKRSLSRAIIPNKGPNKLHMGTGGTGARGNLFIREDGTAVVIFNVNAFPDHDTAKYAADEWKLGSALEEAGDLDGAQVHYKNALNQTMSFSVLEANAGDYRSAYEIACIVEDVPTGEATRLAGGPETVLGIQNPRPIAISTSGASAASLFDEPVEEETKTPVAKAVVTGSRRNRATAKA